MTTVIRVEGLGKSYTLRHQRNGGAGYRRLSEDLLNAIKRPFRKRTSPSNGNAKNEEFWALKNVSFDMKQGEVLGIIGRNGAGKSTLLKILSRITEPTEGRVRIKGRVASLLEVGTGFHPELTGRENIFLNGAILGMSRSEIRRKFDEIVAFAEVEKFLDTPVKKYSSGMYVRLAFAVACHLEPEILVVDEVLAVGDAEFQKKCLGKMSEVAERGRTVLFVSHNMTAMQKLCSRGLVLKAGELQFESPITDAIAYYSDRISFNRSDRASLPHVLYEARIPDTADFGLTRIEALDGKGNPKPDVATWDDVLFRISYSCRRRVANGSVILTLSVFCGPAVILLSTRPDADLSLSLEPGEHSVECFIERLPLAAGDYCIGGGLARPGIEWLCFDSEMARLTVHPADVYRSGHAPIAQRSLVAVSHRWRVVC
jgi:lipopolysaccharide transport system ATP-binding protein